MPDAADRMRRAAERGWALAAFAGGVAVAASGCGGAPSPAVPAGEPMVAITRVAVLDVEHGRLRPNQTVLIDRSLIAAVGPSDSVTVPPDAQVIDGGGRVLSPGFADMHVHLHTEGDLVSYIANGITTVRNMAGDSTHLRMRRRVTAGEILGPRIVTAGPVVEAPPLSHPDNAALDDPALVRQALARQRAAGYDFVKVYNALAAPVYDSVVTIARSLGMPVAGHVPESVGLDGALSRRQRSIEHFRGYVRELLPPGDSLVQRASFRDRTLAWTRIDTTRLAALVRRTVAAGSWNVPTFTFTVHELSPGVEHAHLVRRPETRYLSLRGLPADRASSGYLRDFSDADYTEAQQGLERQFSLLRALDGAGAGLLVGTDSWLGGFAFADELALLVRAGLTPARAIRMATLDAAYFLGEEREWGTIAAGRRADLVLLEASPLEDIANVRRIHAVVVRGRVHTRQALDAALAATVPRRVGM